MDVKTFDSLSDDDFMNGAFRDDIRRALKDCATKDQRLAALEADLLALLTSARHLIRAQLHGTPDDEGPYLTAFAELQEAVARVGGWDE